MGDEGTGAAAVVEPDRAFGSLGAEYRSASVSPSLCPPNKDPKDFIPPGESKPTAKFSNILKMIFNIVLSIV